MILASIPSPGEGVWHLGPLPLRAYALCILAGVVVAIWLGNRRWVARGGAPGTMSDLAVWAVPFGLVGARLYHVVTDPELYFGDGKDPWSALYIWKGGLGVWGAIALGAVGAYVGCRIKGISLRAVADAAAPGIALAQAIGRFGNYFNQELFGRPTTLPWALQIDPSHRPEGLEDRSTYQPTFLYEAIWDVGVAGLVIWAERRFRLGFGRAFALYVMAYTLGRGWIEYLRIDTANHVLGLRLNVWTSVVVFALALGYFVVSARRHPGRQDVVPTYSPTESPTESPAESPTGPPAEPAGEETIADESHAGETFVDEARADETVVVESPREVET